ncbi:hypothetical protein D4R78_06240 [bacterium]|nr:MAG: hypothetical protein D4R78_06240 [bacterium]
MGKESIKAKDNKKFVFLCQINEKSFTVVKCLRNIYSKIEFIDCDLEEIRPGIDDKALSSIIKEVFGRFSYADNPLIISLPRHQSTCRYLRIPASSPEEIEKILSFQAAKYLPYSPEELITGYKVLSTDNEGYVHINLVIAHRDLIERYLHIFKSAGINNVHINLSSYGLVIFYKYVRPKDRDVVLLVDIGLSHIELTIASQGDELFSRSFRITVGQDWGDSLYEEINKTHNAYLQEKGKKIPGKIVILGSQGNCERALNNLDKRLALPIESIPYLDNINASGGFIKGISGIDGSLASILGLAFEKMPDSLDLLPQEVKESRRVLVRHKEYASFALLGSIALILFALGAAKSVENKTRYLDRLKSEMGKLEKDARPLEELEKKTRLLDSRVDSKSSASDIFYELHRVIPEEISLVNLGYTYDKQVVLRGQALNLGVALKLVSQLEKSPLMRKFNIKIRYATKKNIQGGEVVDFEIVCLKNS